MSEQVAQRLSGQELADDVRLALVRAGVEHSEDVRVIQRGRSSCFLVEAAQAIRVCRVARREDLDRNIAPKALVACGVDLTHAPLAQQGYYLVRADEGARHESHCG